MTLARGGLYSGKTMGNDKGKEVKGDISHVVQDGGEYGTSRSKIPPGCAYGLAYTASPISRRNIALYRGTEVPSIMIGSPP